MMQRHKGRFAYLDATFRLFKSRNQNLFNAQQVYEVYNILAPKMLQMTHIEVSSLMRSYRHVLGLKKDHIEYHTTSSGAHPVTIWTWS